MKFILLVIFSMLALGLSFLNGYVKPYKSINTLNMIFQSKSSSSVSIPANKKVCVITGTSSGLGKETAKALLNTNDYFVICAVRDVEKMKAIAEQEGFDKKNYAILECELASFESTKKFVTNLKKLSSRPLDRLVCNAAVYQPALDKVNNYVRYYISKLYICIA